MGDRGAGHHAGHHWRFLRAGGFDQARIDTGADLLALEALDRKLWVALAMPTTGVEIDPDLAKLLDGDKDGRIRADDILAVVHWLRLVVKDSMALHPGEGAMPLAALDEATEEGAAVLASARHILRTIGKPEADSITLDEARDTARIFADTAFNGDGVVPEATAPDDDLKQLIREIIAAEGLVVDRSSAPGVTDVTVGLFYDQAAAACTWLDQLTPDLMPLGEATEAAADAVAAVADKIDGFFLRRAMAAYSSEAASAVNPPPETYAPIADKPVAESLALLRPLPLAEVAADSDLPLGDGVNPAWVGEIATFRAAVVEPLLGPSDMLSGADWSVIKDRLAPYRSWQLAKPPGAVAEMEPARLREIVAGDGHARLLDLAAQDAALAPQAASIDQVWKLMVLRRHLLHLANNFVSFGDFYTKRGKAIFQAGTLYLDGRAAELTLRVDDPARHALLAGLARIYLVYCDLKRADGAKMQIVAAFTAGDSDQLMVGRNGVFYDRAGAEWDATIIKIVDNPISLRQALFAPYRYVARAIGDQIDKFAAARATAMQAELSAATASAAKVVAAPGTAAAPTPTAVVPPPPPPLPAIDAARYAGIFAALGLAAGAIGTALASVVTGFLRLAWWQMPVALIGLLAAISAPSLILAFVKLRQRNLGPLLDASGWAVNARARINIPFGGSLTALPHLPPGSERALTDPYADKRAPWGPILALLLLVVIVIVAWRLYTVYQPH